MTICETLARWYHWLRTLVLWREACFASEEVSADLASHGGVKRWAATMSDFDQPTGSIPPEAPAVTEVGLQPGDVVGRYRLLGCLGSGGFGVVFEAEQREPVRRRVALKVIKPGMDSKAVIARFEAERQALALMDHPSVARVYDGGTTEEGRPYFAMELVTGEPITVHCDRQRLGVRTRLELFIRVCEAVQHAHHKGVVHRDLKPSNILVEYEDGKSTPKVIDFGVAKALHQRLTDATIFTGHGQMIGTPEYMSPEQAEMSGTDIDTRSDVYSLGVLLYELLTGSRPFDGETLRRAALAEIQRVIREVDPPKPSTRLSTAAEANSVATSRSTEIRSLSSMLRRDLDWVCMKCLEKDRERRYETANALADDLRRFLSDEPVTAGPPSALYRLSKFVRRNRAGVVAASLIGAALIAGLAGTSFGLLEASRQAGIAAERADEAEAALERATEAEAEAEERAEQLQIVADFQAEQLGSIDAPKMGIDLRDTLVHRYAQKLERIGLSHDEALAQAQSLDGSLDGVDFTGLALESLEANVFDPALDAIDRQFEDQPLVRAQLQQTLATVLRDAGLLQAAEQPQREALEVRRRVLGDEHPDTLASVGNMGALRRAQGRLVEAEPYYRDALEARRRVLGDEHPDTLVSINNMGVLLKAQGWLDGAEPYYREALQARRRVLGDKHPSTINSIGNMGALLRSQGRLAEAEPFHREALETSRRVLGDEHPRTLTLINSMGLLLVSLGRLTEAESYYLEALNARRRVLGDEHPSTLTSIDSLGLLLRSLGRQNEAELYFREALSARRRVLGDEHPETLNSINNMGLVLESRGRLADAETFFREALEASRRVLGDEHPHTLITINNMGALLESQGRLKEAEPFRWEALEASRRVLGDDHPETLTSINNMGALLESQGRLREAEPFRREALETGRRVLGEEHPNTLTFINNMGGLLQSQGRTAEAERYYREALGMSRRVLGDEHPRTLIVISNLALVLADAGDGAEALKFANEAVEIGRRAIGAEHWLVGNFMGKRGRALEELGRFAEAASVMGEGYAILAAQLGDEHEQTTRVVGYIANLYDAWHEAEPDATRNSIAAEWKAKLEQAEAGEPDE